MYKDKKIAVIIAAAGEGKRMNSGVPKQYLMIDGKAMLVRAAEAFFNNNCVDYIIVVANDGYLKKCGGLLSENGIVATVVRGGATRQDSVYAGLKKLPEEADYVLIHDAARPFVTDDIICETIRAAVDKQAVTCAVPVTDTIRIKRDGGSSVTPDRNTLYAVQTPQAFEKKLIFAAYEKAYSDGFYGTDDAALAERAGYYVHIIEGAYDNIKITTGSDMTAAHEVRVGTGFDAHAFAMGRKLVLGGAVIPFDRGLAGHSDADVLVHAVIDSLLGAAGCGDIGLHFPDTDEKYKDISSLALLEATAGIIKEKGFAIGNIDITVIAERPKVAPHVKEMEKNIAGALRVREDKINIKGTTTERLGFTGREEGIAAQAVCTLR